MRTLLFVAIRTHPLWSDRDFRNFRPLWVLFFGGWACSSTNSNAEGAGALKMVIPKGILPGQRWCASKGRHLTAQRTPRVSFFLKKSAPGSQRRCCGQTEGGGRAASGPDPPALCCCPGVPSWWWPMPCPPRRTKRMRCVRRRVLYAVDAFFTMLPVSLGKTGGLSWLVCRAWHVCVADPNACLIRN